WIQKIYPAGKGGLFIGTASQGIKQFNIEQSQYKDLLIFNPDKTTVFVRDIRQYAEDEFWFATESGIFILNTKTGEFTNLKKKFRDPYSLSDNAVYTVCKDKEGGMWAGTYFGGINYYSKQNAVFEKYFPDNSTNAISGSAVREIVEDHSGNIWIGTEDAGLNKLTPSTGDITQFKPTGESNSIAYTNIHGLMADGNELWIGTFEHGLDVMDLSTEKVVRHYSASQDATALKSNFIVSMLKTSNEDIYVGTSNSLFKYNRANKNFSPVTTIAPNLFIACMLEASDKTIWVGTQHKGLYYFNPATNKYGHFENEPALENSLSTNTINTIFEDSKHTIWIATDGGGLCKLSSDKKVFFRFTTANGLPSNFIFKVLEDEKKSMWVSTSRGLVNFNPEKGAGFTYTKANGLLNDQFNYNSGYKSGDGKMYFGSIKGMITFNPDNLMRSSRNPPVFITGFQVQNKELAINKDSSALKQSIIYTGDITLPHDRSSFSIDFAALSYISPEMTVYSYFMVGLDREWTIIKPNRKIYFTNLSPGEYTFKIKAAINGNNSHEEKQLTITILPPWWATIWAYLFYAAAFIGLAYYLLTTYHIIIEDKKEKEIYEAKIEFFTNVAHEIRTPLTLIKGPVENLLELVDELPQIKEEVITMERNTNRLITLITQILDFRKAETKGFSIDFIKVNITSLLQEAHINFAALAKKRKLEYLLNLPSTEVVVLADEEALTKVFSNLYNNAIKYAHSKVDIRLLLPDEANPGITIEFMNDGQKIPAAMKDKIFEPFYRLKESLKQQGTGIGLALAKSLTELHKGHLYLKDSGEAENIFVVHLPLQPMQEGIKIKKTNRLLNTK
ncbi:MAG: hybrid sensor histidine kinase/response regulator, partial [Ferruginibacter sp.]|nr:hybrid sensor histidine kinase/response regulator [Ferruginibacter sp.]